MGSAGIDADHRTGRAGATCIARRPSTGNDELRCSGPPRDTRSASLNTDSVFTVSYGAQRCWLLTGDARFGVSVRWSGRRGRRSPLGGPRPKATTVARHGMGTGLVVQALPDGFDGVIGIDVDPDLLQVARCAVVARHGVECRPSLRRSRAGSVTEASRACRCHAGSPGWCPFW